MISVNFVCLGNICRSPMGELIFKKLVEEEGLALSFEITSCGTSSYEVGNCIYPPAQRVLKSHGVCGSHTARQIQKRDIVNCDYILCMDSNNLLDVLRLAGSEYGGKVYKLLSFTGEARDVADPWYTGDFERAYADIYNGCRAFLQFLLTQHGAELDYDRRH